MNEITVKSVGSYFEIYHDNHLIGSRFNRKDAEALAAKYRVVYGEPIELDYTHKIHSPHGFARACEGQTITYSEKENTVLYKCALCGKEVRRPVVNGKYDASINCPKGCNTPVVPA